MTRAGGVAWLPAAAELARRDLVLFGRQRSRVVAAVATPLMVWVFLVAGFSGGLAERLAPSEEAGPFVPYAVSAALGAALLVVLFSAIFNAISLIRDRDSGFMQAVLAGPTPLPVVLASRVVTGAVLAWAQGLVLLAAAVIAQVSAGHTPPPAWGVGLAAAALLTAALGVMGLAVFAAWLVDSTEGFHAVMNGVLMPMWLLSGAAFPVGAAAGWLFVLGLLNPMGWAHRAMVAAFAPASSHAGAAGPWVWAGLTLFAGVLVAALGAVLPRPPGTAPPAGTGPGTGPGAGDAEHPAAQTR